MAPTRPFHWEYDAPAVPDETIRIEGRRSLRGDVPISGSKNAALKMLAAATLTGERCRIVLNDREYAAQVRFKAPEGRSQVRLFDDLGCAVLWLEDKPFRDAPSTKIWVTDWRSVAWIDARAATYLPGQRTPMGYGLGAQPEPGQGGLNFEQARGRILASEGGSHPHGMP